MCKSRHFLCCMVAFIGLASPAFAQKPDKQTPAAEDMCNALKADGVTKGLYGLCVAFCKAKDHGGASPQSLESIRTNYDKRKKEGDPTIPCADALASQPPVAVVQACPCWTDAEASAIDGVLTDGSTGWGWPAPTSHPSVCSTDPTNRYLSETGTVNFAMERTYIRTVEQSAIHRCEYQTVRAGQVVAYPLLSVEQGTLTVEQLAACTADLVARQAALGVCQ